MLTLFLFHQHRRMRGALAEEFDAAISDMADRQATPVPPELPVPFLLDAGDA
jgi:hypothetical protein